MRHKGIVFLFILSILFVSCDKNEDMQIEWEPQHIDENLNRDSEYIVVIGDIQEYTNDNERSIYYEETMRWIWSQYRYGINIKCILQVGDITNNNTRNQYETFYRYTYPVANVIPYIACIGNHDYVWNADLKIENRNQTSFSDYTSFELTKSIVVDSFEPNRMENIVVENIINGRPYYILVLEFGARQEVVKWARGCVKKCKDKKFILMTHEFLSRDGNRISANSYAGLQLKNTTWSTPEEIWDDMIKDNDNIVCVLCGHNGFYSYQFSPNSFGRMVPQILFNLQYQDNGGNGMVQLWEFPQGNDSVYIDVYNTIQRQWYSDSTSTKFSFKYIY